MTGIVLKAAGWRIWSCIYGLGPIVCRAVTGFDCYDIGHCSNALYRLPGGVPSCRVPRAAAWGSVNAQTRKAESEGGGVGSVNAQTRKAEAGVGAVNAQTRKAEAGVGAVNAQTQKAEALAQMPASRTNSGGLPPPPRQAIVGLASITGA